MFRSDWKVFYIFFVLNQISFFVLSFKPDFFLYSDFMWYLDQRLFVSDSLVTLHVFLIIYFEDTFYFINEYLFSNLSRHHLILLYMYNLYVYFCSFIDSFLRLV